MKLGQNDGVKKLRELRKDIARIKTVARERRSGRFAWRAAPKESERGCKQPAKSERRQTKGGRQNDG